MDPKPSTRLSPRDAIKVLGAAAGASALANLPSKARFLAYKIPRVSAS